MGRGLHELKPPGRWVGQPLEVLDTIDSTNRIAEERARTGAPHGTLVIADRQTAGRGRLGRSFFSPGGRSLYLSLLLRPQIPPEQLHCHVFCAAVAVAETARTWLPPEISVEIKWPNDVLLDGRKTSGINLPAQVEGGKVTWAVLGIGVNVNTLRDEFPPELRDLATSLRIASGATLDRIGVCEDLLARLEGGLDRLYAGDFAGVLDRWRDFFRMQGARVRVGGPGVARELSGIVAGVDEEGALLLSDGAGGKSAERILAGDVTILDRQPSESAEG